MAGSDLTLLDKIRGKRTRDIELPNESGKVDSRLEPYQPGAVGQAMKRAFAGVDVLKKKGLLNGSSRSQGGKR